VAFSRDHIIHQSRRGLCFIRYFQGACLQGAYLWGAAKPPARLAAAACALTIALSPGIADAAAPGNARSLGRFKDWTAATVQQGGKTVCYAFTPIRAVGSQPSESDETAFAISHGNTPGDAIALGIDTDVLKDKDEVTVRVGQERFRFFMNDGNAFSSRPDDVIAAFKDGMAAYISGGGNKNIGEWTFSLAGFTAAYHAEKKECQP
jgi:hypothetical protein